MSSARARLDTLRGFVAPTIVALGMLFYANEGNACTSDFQCSPQICKITTPGLEGTCQDIIVVPEPDSFGLLLTCVAVVAIAGGLTPILQRRALGRGPQA
jgi:hypothetical protein